MLPVRFNHYGSILLVPIIRDRQNHENMKKRGRELTPLFSISIGFRKRKHGK
jgi:hypothetical protein